MQFYYTLSIRYNIAYVKFKHPVYFGGGGGVQSSSIGGLHMISIKLNCPEEIKNNYL